MNSVSTLADLKAELDQQNQGGNFSLTMENSAAEKLRLFLSTLPLQRINLSGATIILDAGANTLTITGNAGAEWAIRGNGARSARIGQVAVVYTRGLNSFEAQLNLDGNITAGATTIPVAGILGDNSQLDFAHTAQSGLSLSLAAIADFISDGKLSSFLPVGVGIFDTVPLTAFQFSFGYNRTAITRFTFTSDANAEWEIIRNFASLKKVGVSLDTQYRYVRGGGFRESIGGNIHATLNIGQDFDVRLALQGQNYWEFDLLPSNGNLLPGLSALAGLAGGEALQNSVQTGLRNLGLETIAVDDVSIGFNLAQKSLRSVTTRGHITVDAMTFNVRVTLPNFGFYGALSPNTPIKLKSLVGKYFAGADAFPEIDITQLGVSAQPSAGRYEFYASIASNWQMQVGGISIGVKRFNFDIVKETSGVTGFVEGIFALAGAELDIIASHPEVGAGWQFDGSTGYGQKIPIGTIISNLATTFGVDDKIPSPIASLTVENLRLFFDTESRDFSFTCEGKFQIEGKEVTILATVILTYDNGRYVKRFGGEITIGTLIFDLHFSSDDTSSLFFASYSHNGDQQKIKIKDLVNEISPEIAAEIPASLEIDLKDVLFAFSSDPGGSAFLFGLDLAASINLSNLPLVGQMFPSNQTVGVDDLRILVASKQFDQTVVSNINKLIPKQVPALPSAEIAKGFNFSASMNFGGSKQTLSLPVTSPDATPSTTPPPAQAATNAVASSDNAKWFTVQKTFGPVHFERVGVQYKDAALAFLLDGSLSFAGLTLSLDGLSVGSPLSKFEPKFNLRGLGIDYSNGPVEIGGAFLKTQVQVGGKTYDEYDGAAVIKTAQFALSAIGSYADLDGHPSLFIYAVLDYPLGGPAFFYVTGLAAGFGYNRSLLMPTIDQVAQFPLVAQAVSGQRAPNNLSTELQSLQRYIPPSVGDVFFAVGVKFTSFKIIDSFVLVTVLFGSRFELNLLGLSTLISPPQTPANVPPLSVVQMAVRASFLPDEGFLGVQAQLTSASYIFTRDCHLTGGFAFFSWFKGDHAGDFVLTLGGYHPNYNLPSHYPRVPRVGINWQVNRNLSIKGSAYFALTASAMMAGGSLQATWLDGNLRAWFNAGADFIVSWKPYHYDARVYVNMGVSYTFNVDLWFTTITKTISVDVGADLHIWGPEFSGTAHIKLWIVSFDVTFGSGASQRPQAIGWNEFRTSFIPDKDEDVCSVAITSGLVKTTEDKKWIVNPKDFCLVTNSVIPSKSASADSLTLPKGATDFGVGPMEVSSDNLDTSHTIKVSRIVNNGKEPASNEFVFNPILKKVPAGLWGKSLTPSLNGQSFVDGALSGFEIRPKNPPAPGHTSEIARANLTEAAQEVPNAYGWEPFKPFTAQQADDEARREAIRAGLAQPGTVSARNRLLNDLGIAGEMTPPPAIASVFTVPPQVGELSR